MKFDTRRVIQHANAAIMLGVCISSFIYFFPFYYIKIGIILWVSSLIFAYCPDLFTFPGASKEGIEDATKIAIASGWSWMTLMIGLVAESTLFMIFGVLFLVVFFVFSYISVIREKKRKEQTSRQVQSR